MTMDITKHQYTVWKCRVGKRADVTGKSTIRFIKCLSKLATREHLAETTEVGLEAQGTWERRCILINLTGFVFWALHLIH